MLKMSRHLLLGAAAGALMFGGQALAQTEATPPLEPRTTDSTAAADRNTAGTVTGTGTGTADHMGATGHHGDTATATMTERREPSEALRAMRIEDLEDKEVQSAEGEDIGQIQRIVRHEGELKAVVALGGGWFNWGAEEVLVPLAMFEPAGDDALRLPLTEAQASALESYAEDVGERVEGDGTVGSMWGDDSADAGTATLTTSPATAGNATERSATTTTTAPVRD